MTVYVPAATGSEYAPDAPVVAVVLAGTVDTITPGMPECVTLSVIVPPIVEFGGAALTGATEKESKETGLPDWAQPYRPMVPAPVIVLLVPDHVHADGSVVPSDQTLR